MPCGDTICRDNNTFSGSRLMLELLAAEVSPPPLSPSGTSGVPLSPSGTSGVPLSPSGTSGVLYTTDTARSFVSRRQTTG